MKGKDGPGFDRPSAVPTPEQDGIEKIETPGSGSSSHRDQVGDPKTMFSQLFSATC
jgi:hypothetical protein